jgi:hypothetical protein
MATVKPVQKDAGPSASDLTPAQWHACKRTPAGIALADSTTSVAGVIEYPGFKAGATTTYHTLGRSKVKVLVAVVAGDKAKISATPGVATKAAAGDEFFGVFAEDGPAGAIVPLDLDRGTLHA